jgi:hypothetical protein
MQRAIYFDGWHRGHHCYHPSLPTRRLSQVRDLERYRATMLVWSALGGGSISLPFLEQEIDGPIAPRDRIYGALSDREFIAECGKRGINVFGIIFQAQGWEFGVELNEDESAILAFNELRGAGTPAQLGLREFTQDRYPKLWKSFSSYFPQGLVNSAGEPVTDLFEECTARGLDGAAYHARWVEAPDGAQNCHYMDKNNPVWREYIKAIIRLQIDAGVQGVQLDEASTPLGTIQYGACFCRDCVRGFRDHLASLSPAELDRATGGEAIDLAGFDYRQYLLQHGLDPAVTKADTPLFLAYYDYMRRVVVLTFNELADYAHAYARAQGREVLVSGNIYNMFPYLNGVMEHLDVIVTEARNLTFRQPEWYRNAVGMAQGKELVVVENPYGGIVQRLVRRLDKGEAYDAARLLAYEAAAMGSNMALPYGAWMGSVVQDSFSLPDTLAVEIQSWLESIDHLTSATSANQVAVLYDIGANAEIALRRQIFADNRFNDVQSEVAAPYWETIAALSDGRLAYDTVPVADSVVPAPHVDAAHLGRYALVVLAGCTRLEPWACAVVSDYVAAGGVVVVVGESNWPDLGERIIRVGSAAAAVREAAARQGFSLATTGRLAVNTHDVGKPDAFVLQVVNYDLDEEHGVLRPATDVELTLPEAIGALRCHRPEAAVVRLWPQSMRDGRNRFVLPPIRGHAVIEGTRKA